MEQFDDCSTELKVLSTFQIDRSITGVVVDDSSLLGLLGPNHNMA